MTDPILPPEIYGIDYAPSAARSYLAFASDDLLLSVLGSRDTAKAYQASAVDHLRIAAEYLGYTLAPK